MPAKEKQFSITRASILFVSLPVLAAAIGDNKKEQAEARASALRAAPAEAACRENPYQSRPEAVLAGRKLFRRHCDDCHGPEAEGTTSAPSLRSRVVQEAAPGTLH